MAGAIETGRFLGRIPYVRGGTGPATAVVFYGANALFERLDRVPPERVAGPVAQVLPPDYSYCILGYDADPPAGFGFDHIVADFAQIVQEHFGRVAVVGVSFGGFVAQRFAAEHAPLVDKLVLLISAHRFSAAGWRKVLRQEAFMRVGDVYGFLRDMALLFRRPWYNWLLGFALWRTRSQLPARLNDPQTLLRMYEGLFAGFDNAPYLGRIQAPTLVVGGERDQFFDAAAFRETAAAIPDARLRLFPGETHMLPLERVRAVREVVSEFLLAAGKR